MSAGAPAFPARRFYVLGAVVAALGAAVFLVETTRPPGVDPSQTVPDFAFADGAGNLVSLSDFHDKTILLNFWATWCTPCRVEMPSLDRLQARLAGPAFDLVAVALDRGGLPAVQRFHDETGIENLAPYAAEPGEIMSALRVPGLPTTILVGPDGREIFRVVGPAEWDSPEMIARITAALADIGTAGAGGPQ